MQIVYQKEILNHISKEIIKNKEFLVSFRLRIVSMLMIIPSIILIALLLGQLRYSKIIFRVIQMTAPELIGILFFLGIAAACLAALIDRTMANHNERLRKSMLKIQLNKPVEFADLSHPAQFQFLYYGLGMVLMVGIILGLMYLN